MSLQDAIFAEDVEGDITLFVQDTRKKRVLVFPPVNNYRRYLIHQLVQDRFGELLKTFSIGQGLARRTVVCYQSDVIRDSKLNGVPSRSRNEPVNSFKLNSSRVTMGVEERLSPPTSPEHSKIKQVKTAPAVEIYRPPAARRASRSCQAPSASPVSVETSASSAKGNHRQRRPDRAVYVPKHRRSSDTDDGANTLEEAVHPRRSRCHRPRENSPNENGSPTTKPSLPHDHHSEKPDTSEKSITDYCEKINERFDKAPRTESPAQDAPLSIDYCSDKEMREGKRDSIESASRSLSASSDEIGNSSERGNGRIGRDVSSDDQATYNARKFNDADISRDCSSSSSTRDNHESDRPSPDDRNEQANNKNRASLRSSCIVSNVLIISDTKVREPERKIVEAVKEVETTPITPPEKKPKKIARAKSKPASPPSPQVKLNRDECDWDSLFDDNGDCLDPTLIEELTAAVGEVTIEQPKSHYKSFTRPVEVSNDEFGHVIEVYNFPSDLKTCDLAAAFSPWKNGGFEIKWVDDTHCLAVFSSSLVAAEVLSSEHPFVKTRPLSEATALSKTKARKSASFLQPYKSRPETCAALARRLVTGALGVRLATAKQEREQEKIVLQEAKEKRRLANKQREDAWEGIIAQK